ncbi:HAD hydrolase family protein [Streptomyces sp. NPDC002187]|uniref:HAD hydrolase family protein n=1 Tax=Streptomyces sp. NPDC002187 TaxID=3364637 RepID=UPI0036BC3C01
MTQPRLIATDLDGTLLRRDGTLSERTLRALRTATDAGADVVFVTARPPRFVDLITIATTGLVGTAVCSNGALVYDLATRTVTASRALALPVARDVATALSAAAPGLGFAVETGHRVLYEPAYGLRFGVPEAEFAVSSLADLWLVDAPIVQLLACSAQFDADMLLRIAENSAGGAAQFTHSGGRGLLEISAAGVTKAGTLSALCAERGIGPEDVVAFGDMPNDLTILRWAGAGYAMGNAHPHVLASAPLRTATNEEDGVAEVLERLYGIG